MLAVEVLLEAASKNTGELQGPEVALILSCGEFAGCCLVAWLCGGGLGEPAGLTGDAEELPTSPRTGKGATLAALARFWLPYVWLALLSLVGTGFANMAIAWVQYPVKVVIKSSKLIPTMVVSVVMGNSRNFAGHEYLAAVLICLGTALLSFGAGRTDVPPEMAVLGICMLIIAILSDVSAANAQQWMMQKRSVKPMSLMFRQNFVSLVGVIMITVALYNASTLTAKIMQHPVVLPYTAAVGLTTAAAVWAMTHLIHDAGSVMLAGVSVLRKLLTIALSYVLFPKPLTAQHLGAIIFVSAGLLLPLTSKMRKAATQPPSCGKQRFVACSPRLSEKAARLCRGHAEGADPEAGSG